MRILLLTSNEYCTAANGSDVERQMEYILKTTSTLPYTEPTTYDVRHIDSGSFLKYDETQRQSDHNYVWTVIDVPNKKSSNTEDNTNAVPERTQVFVSRLEETCRQKNTNKQVISSAGEAANADSDNTSEADIVIACFQEMFAGTLTETLTDTHKQFETQLHMGTLLQQKLYNKQHQAYVKGIMGEANLGTLKSMKVGIYTWTKAGVRCNNFHNFPCPSFASKFALMPLTTKQMVKIGFLIDDTLEVHLGNIHLPMKENLYMNNMSLKHRAKSLVNSSRVDKIRNNPMRQVERNEKLFTAIGIMEAHSPIQNGGARCMSMTRRRLRLSRSRGDSSRRLGKKSHQYRYSKMATCGGMRFQQGTVTSNTGGAAGAFTQRRIPMGSKTRFRNRAKLQSRSTVRRRRRTKTRYCPHPKDRGGGDPSVIMEGWLYKKGKDLLQGWNKRWCVFESNNKTLTYYDDCELKKRKKKGSISIQSFWNIPDRPDARVSRFDLQSNNDVLYSMAASSEEDKQRWLEYIRQADCKSLLLDTHPRKTEFVEFARNVEDAPKPAEAEQNNTSSTYIQTFKDNDMLSGVQSSSYDTPKVTLTQRGWKDIVYEWLTDDTNKINFCPTCELKHHHQKRPPEWHELQNLVQSNNFNGNVTYEEWRNMDKTSPYVLEKNSAYNWPSYCDRILVKADRENERYVIRILMGDLNYRVLPHKFHEKIVEDVRNSAIFSSASDHPPAPTLVAHATE